MIFFINFLILFPYLLYGSLITTNEIKPILDLADPSTLVIIDIADTIIEFKDVVLQKEYDEWKNGYYDEIFPNASFEETARFIQIVEENPSNWKLVNQYWPCWINELKLKGVKVIGVTKTLVYCSLQKSLMDTLAYFGITFSDDIIATSLPAKDKIVKELLQKFRPNFVIFIDDRIDQVEMVEKALIESKTNHLIIHYNTPHIPLPLDINKAKLQIETLVNRQVWLND